MPLRNRGQALEVPDLLDVDTEFGLGHADQRQLARVRKIEVQAIADQVRLATRARAERNLGRRDIQVAGQDLAQCAVPDLVSALMISEPIAA